jgi:hypothetical protein
MLDTAWIYQNQTPDGATHFNESLVGRALEKFGRDKFGAPFVAIIDFVTHAERRPQSSQPNSCRRA